MKCVQYYSGLWTNDNLFNRLHTQQYLNISFSAKYILALLGSIAKKYIYIVYVLYYAQLSFFQAGSLFNNALRLKKPKYASRGGPTQGNYAIRHYYLPTMVLQLINVGLLTALLTAVYLQDVTQVQKVKKVECRRSVSRSSLTISITPPPALLHLYCICTLSPIEKQAYRDKA
jgi:hypothetical protein